MTQWSSYNVLCTVIDVVTTDKVDTVYLLTRDWRELLGVLYD